MNAFETAQAPALGIKSVAKWRAEVGLSSVTAWRFAKRGWIQTVNVAGRPYITAEEQERFTRRATAGEFAKQHHAPKPPRGAN